MQCKWCVPTQYRRYCCVVVLIASAFSVVILIEFYYTVTKQTFTASRGDTEPLTNYTRTVPEEKSESTTEATNRGSAPHAGALSLDHDRINDVNPTDRMQVAIAIGEELQECDGVGCILNEPGDPAGDKVEMKKGIEKQSQIKGEKDKKKATINPTHSPTWLVQLFRHIFVSFLGLAVGYDLIMSCIGRLYGTWLKYRWVVACILAFLVLLLFASNNSHELIGTLRTGIGQMKAEIKLCNVSLHNEIQTNAKRRKYAMEQHKNHTKVLEYRCIQRINRELDEVKNQTRAVTDEKEHRVKNCDQQLIEMKGKISEKDKIILIKDQAIGKLLLETNKLRNGMDLQTLKFENEGKQNSNDKQQLINELASMKDELQWYKEHYPYAKYIAVVLAIILLLTCCACCASIVNTSSPNQRSRN